MSLVENAGNMMRVRGKRSRGKNDYVYIENYSCDRDQFITSMEG